MSKRRTIDPKIRSSQTFAMLTYRQRDLWQGMIEAGFDDQGRMPGHPAYVRSTVWPYDDVSLSEIEEDLNRLQELGMLFRYEKNGSIFAQAINWHYYQRDAEWLAQSDYPAADGWIAHARYHGKGKEGILTLNWDTRLEPPTLPTPLPTHLPIGIPTRDINVKGNGNGDDKDDEEGEGKKKKSGAGAPMPAVEEKPEDQKAANLEKEVLAYWRTLFPNKPQPRPGTYRDKIITRFKSEHFRENWQTALSKASLSPTCQNESWFNFGFFIKNDENYQNMLNNWMEWKDQENYNAPKPNGTGQRPSKSELIDAAFGVKGVLINGTQ